MKEHDSYYWFRHRETGELIIGEINWMQNLIYWHGVVEPERFLDVLANYDNIGPVHEPAIGGTR